MFWLEHEIVFGTWQEQLNNGFPRAPGGQSTFDNCREVRSPPAKVVIGIYHRNSRGFRFGPEFSQTFSSRNGASQKPIGAREIHRVYDIHKKDRHGTRIRRTTVEILI